MAPTKMPSSSNWMLSVGAWISRPMLSSIASPPPSMSAWVFLCGTAPAREGGGGPLCHFNPISVLSDLILAFPWPFDLMRRPFGRRHHVEFAGLDLAEHHRLGDVVASLGELDLAIEGRHVGRRQGVAHFFGVERLGFFERGLPHLHRRRRLRGLIGHVLVALEGLLEQLVVVRRRAEQRILVGERL